MSHEDRREHIRDMRLEIGRRRMEGGWDDEALKWAEWYLEQAENLAVTSDFERVHEAVFLSYLNSANRHLVWARHPVRDSEKQSWTGRQPRSAGKAAALAAYKAADPAPQTIAEFIHMLDGAGVAYASGDWGKTYNKVRAWFQEARGRRKNRAT